MKLKKDALAEWSEDLLKQFIDAVSLSFVAGGKAAVVVNQGDSACVREHQMTVFLTETPVQKLQCDSWKKGTQWQPYQKLTLVRVKAT